MQLAQCKLSRSAIVNLTDSLRRGFIATIIRLKTLLDFKISIDPTWEYVEVTIWTSIELAAGFVSVSLPAIRQLLVMVIPERFTQRVVSFVKRTPRETRDDSGVAMTPIGPYGNLGETDQETRGFNQ